MCLPYRLKVPHKCRTRIGYHPRVASVIHEPQRPRKAWRVDWVQHGRRHTRRFRTRREAQAFAGRTAEGPVQVAGRETLAGWAERWARHHYPTVEPGTRRNYADLLDKWVLPWLGGARLAQLTRQDVRDWRDQIRAAGCPSYSANKAAAVLRLVLKAALDDEVIGANPAAGLRRLPTVKPERVPATLVEVEAIRLAVPGPLDRVAVGLMAYAGLRPGEVAALRWTDVREGSVTVRHGGRVTGQTKTGNIRVVPFIAPLAQDLAAVADRDGEPGFQDVGNWRSRVWKPAAARVGAGHLTPYSLRHTYASLLIAEGRQVHEVARLLGHTTVALTLSTYGHLFDEAQIHASEDMAAAVVRARHEASRSA